jgi:prolyl-tRNA editing enzyme YbaK/EbsC (Cys-tRNA(Pro) deacylase)
MDEEMFQLQEEQAYIYDIASKLSIETKLAYHPYPTDTCAEKCALLRESGLEWDLDRVVKAIYFRKKGHTVCVVTPELESRLDMETILATVLGTSKEDAAKYKTNGFTPTGMEKGTCTPFPLESSIGSEIHDIIIYDHPRIDDKLVDISVGGKGMDAHMVSMHIPYSGIYRILKEAFGDRHIHKYIPVRDYSAVGQDSEIALGG